MVWQFVDAIRRVVNSGKIEDDDFADRLNRRYTVGVLVLFCILVGSSQYVGSPIACWAPAEFTGAMVTYTNYICWIANTYYVPTDQSLPNPNQPRDYMINYYQWVPFIFAMMAIFFYFPFLVWHLMAKPNGLDAKTIMKLVRSMNPSDGDSRDKTMRNAVKLIDRAVDYRRKYYDISFLGLMRRKVGRCCLPSFRSGYYICTLYMLVKLLYILNVCGQFFLLNLFMGPDFNLYGFQVIRDAFHKASFWESSRFPRVTMCDFVIRQLGDNNQRMAVQCTLPINLYNEKIFIFIWFWMFGVAALSVYSLLTWLCTFSSSSRMLFVKSYLNSYMPYRDCESTVSTVDEKVLDSFLYEYLRYDGVFLLRIVKKNSNDMVVGELVNALWENFKRCPRFALATSGEKDGDEEGGAKYPQLNANVSYGFHA